MADFKREKQRVKSFYDDLDTAEISDLPQAMGRHCAVDLRWCGFSPFDRIDGAEAVAQQFWTPLRSSLSSMRRRIDVFMAGENFITDTGGIWVASMGHLMGLFDQPWLGIPPTGKMAFLRYSAFHRVQDDRIAETAMYFDIPHLMLQAGLRPFPEQTGAHLVQPGPQTHDGVMFENQPPEAGQKTMQVMNQMIADLGQWQGGLPLRDELRRTWWEDMIWWGPAGIGATFTIDRYAQQHAGPFRASFDQRSPTQHRCRIAEGHFSGFFGWPNFTAVPIGGFMGMPATGRPGEFRVIDIYRREGDKLAENWIFIDLLHFWKMQGVDILKRTTEIGHP